MGGLAELQDALVKAVTAQVGEDDGEGLPPPLQGLSRPDVARYARGLCAKRWREVARALPLSARHAGGLEARYTRWLLAHPAPACDGVLPPGLAEGLRALPDLSRQLADDRAEPPWAGELLAFEVLRGCARVDRAQRFLRAHHAVHEIATDLLAGLVPVDPAPAPHLYLFEARRTRWRRLS